MSATTSAVRAPAVERGHAFGLAVSADFEIPELPRPVPGPERPRVVLADTSPGDIRRAWPRHGTTVVYERPDSRGRPGMRIEQSAEGDYRIAAPLHGRHIVSADGRSVDAAIASIPYARWQRLLFAQVLPLAATLHGFALFHASAVHVGGRTLAFIASSGTGKTSLAVHLLGEGGAFVTDDVLSLAPSDNGDVVAHPGAGVVGVADAELEALERSHAVLGTVIGRSDKALVRVQPMASPTRLDAMYFLRRTSDHGEVAVTRARADPQRLLASAFITYVKAPRHLLRHLDVCAAVAARVPLFDVAIPLGRDAAAVAARIADHASRSEWP
jgi:hypothetical protein